MKRRINTVVLMVGVWASTCMAETDAVRFTSERVSVDGNASESAWQRAEWRSLDKHILGEYPDPQDFAGRYKLLWDAEHLYLLAEITDDVLFDQHADPLLRYWDDDCLEIFIDEDASGGNHQFSYNAFAYHIALDNQTVDIGGQLEDGSPEFLLLNEHVESRWRRQPDRPHTIVWEVAIKIFDDTFEPNAGSAPLTLAAGKTMGFMLAYCDNDGSDEREHFVGSHEIVPVNGDKNLGYIDADVFGAITLSPPAQ